MIKTIDINEARKNIETLKKQGKKVIVLAQDEDFNRKILEIKGVDILLFSPEVNFKKERLKQRDSGINEHLCKTAVKNKVKIGINLCNIKNLEKKEKAVALARIFQNIRLCKKFKAEIIFFPEIQKYEISALYYLAKA